MKLRLTDIAVRRLAFPPSGQITYWDETTPGFGLRCSTKSKSFVVMYGDQRRLKTIGRYPALSLSDARKEARRFLANYLENPAKIEIEIPFAKARDEFLKACASRNKPRTVSDYTRLLNRHFHYKTNLHSLTRQQIMKTISKLSETPSEQTHAYVVIRTMMNWCVRHGYLEHSPVPSLRLNTVSKNRVLTKEELRAVYRRSIEYPYPYGPIVQLIILTGQRRGEIAALRRSWLIDNTIVFPEGFTKNKHEHHLPLPPTAIDLLQKLPNRCDLFFPSRINNKKPFNGWGRCKARLDEPLNLKPYTLHDLRRTFSSNMAMLGIPIQVTEKILNHVSGTISGVAAIYNRYSYFNEMKEALEMYDEFLDHL